VITAIPDRPVVPIAVDGLPEGWPQDHGIPTAGPQVLAWGECTLCQPDGDRAGQPWAWTDSQARFVSWWYALDESGRYLWRRAQTTLPKGAGKSPMMAALACVELAGPVVCRGFDDAGVPVMVPHPSPDVKLSALSLAQAVDATLGLANAMLDSAAAAREIPGLDVGLTRIRTKRGMLSPATAKAPSKEGPRYTAVILDESHLWNRGNGGDRLAAVLRRNLGKMDGRSVEATNMWVQGGGSVAEATATYADAVASGAHVGDGVLRWHPVGQCDDLGDEDTLRAALRSLYADSPWINIDRIVQEIYDGDTHPSDARRYYLNQPASADDAWLRADLWLACEDKSKRVEDGDTVVLGFDGSRGRARGNADATALVGCRVGDGHLFEIGVWQGRRDDVDWTPPEAVIDAVVAETFRRYRVVGFYADPSLWEARITAWEATYARRFKVRAGVHPIQWPTNRASAVVKAAESFEQAVTNGDLTHDGSYRLTEHALNARRVALARAGIGVGKESKDSTRKIDAIYAAMLAWQARLDALAVGAGGTPGRGRVIGLS